MCLIITNQQLTCHLPFTLGCWKNCKGLTLLSPSLFVYWLIKLTFLIVTAILRNTISFSNCPCIILYLKWFDIKKNWDIEDGEASEQLHQKRNSFYLEITLEISFFFSLEKKRISQSFNGWFPILSLFICKNYFFN